LDDHQRLAPRPETAREEDQQRSIGARNAWPFARTGQDDHLLAQEGVLGDQLRLTRTRSVAAPRTSELAVAGRSHRVSTPTGARLRPLILVCLTSIRASPQNVLLADDEPLDLRVFVDRSVVEVVANGRQCLAVRDDPGRPDSVGVALRSIGQDTTLASLDAWRMASIYP
jgi:hypothetical protein